MHKLIFLFCFILLHSVEKHKFKTCNQAGFCKRQQDFADNAERAHFEIGADFQILADGITTKFQHPSNGVPLRMTVQAVKESIWRIQIKEETPLRKRYQLEDVLTPEARKPIPVEQLQNNRAIRHGSSSVMLPSGTNQLIFSQEVDGKEVDAVAFNAANLLYFEPYKNKEEGDDWNEKFGSHTDEQPRGPASIGGDFTFIGSNHVFGIPEHASDFNLKQTRNGGYDEPFRMFNLDVFEYILDVPMALYGSIPFLVSHSSEITTGVFWANAAETYIHIWPLQNGKQTSFHSETGVLEAFVILGPSPSQVMQQYYHLTGYPQLPPLFAISYHQCRWNYNDMADVTAVNSGFEDNDIPYDVLWLDIEHTNGKRYFTWDKFAFAEPKKMIDDIASYGRKMVTIIDPHIKKDDGYHVYKQAHDRGLFVRKQDGSEYSGWCWPGTSAYLDFCKPEVREYWASLFEFDTYEGSAPTLFTWNDMNEPSVFDGPEVSMPRTNLHGADDWEHRDVHNLYGYYVHMATFEGHLKRAPNTRPFVLSRAFFAGSQRYGAVWTGDNMANWEHLKASVPMLLSHSIAGLPFIGADVGGFFGNPDAELLWRWYQVGAYQPFFRGHAHKETARREPWLFPDYTERIGKAIATRYRILPYVYTMFYQSATSGEPVNRPVWFEFPKDDSSFAREDCFLLGPALLVFPVVEPNKRGWQSVTLPGTSATTWYLARSPHTAFQGSYSASVDITNDIPVFQRGGTIVTEKRRKRRSSTQMKNDPYTLVIAPQNGFATGFLYLDDGATFDFTDNKYELRMLTLLDGKVMNVLASTARYSTEEVVERIIILGKEFKDASVGGVKLSTRIEGNALYIRKPGLKINEDWTIDLS